MTKVSIIIRTHNEEKWIGQCLERVLAQTIDDIEIILVDNRSTDKTVQKAKNVAPDITIVQIDDYMPGLALNKGVRASSGEYFICLSAHCVPVDNYWLENLLDEIQADSAVAGVYGRQVPVESSDPVDKRDLIRTFGLERQVQERDTFFHNANSIIRREVWEEHQFKEDVTNIEDQIWGNEVINAGFKLIYEPDAAVYHHHGINQGNDEGRTRSVVRTMETNDIQPEHKLDGKLEGNPFDPEGLDIVAFVPVRHSIDSGVDFTESLVRETIDAANDASYIDDVVLLTDSEQVANQADSWGARAPFIRPDELSERDVPVVDVFQFGLREMEKEHDRYPDIVVPLEVTHPFRTAGMLDNLITKLLETGEDSVVAALPEYRPCWVQGDHGIERVNEETQFRADRSPVYIGLVSLGCVTYPHHIRHGTRVPENTKIYEVTNPLASIEIRQREDIDYWEKLKDIDETLL